MQSQMRYGAKVSQVVEGSGAERAGIKVGDHIISIDDEAVSSGTDVTQIVGEHKVGDKIKIGIIRDNKTMTLTAELGEYKGE